MTEHQFTKQLPYMCTIKGELTRGDSCKGVSELTRGGSCKGVSELTRGDTCKGVSENGNEIQSFQKEAAIMKSTQRLCYKELIQ